jgi:hypothetical protein
VKYPSFEDLAEVIRDSVRLKRVERIDPDTQFVRDLVITERLGIDLLKAIEMHYGIEFAAESYDRMQSECSFHSKETGESPVIQPLFGSSFSEGPSLTVGQLYGTVLRELSRRPEMSQKSSTSPQKLRVNGSP